MSVGKARLKQHHGSHLLISIVEKGLHLLAAAPYLTQLKEKTHQDELFWVEKQSTTKRIYSTSSPYCTAASVRHSFTTLLSDG